MKSIFPLLILLLVGAINLSASKSDRLQGRWKAYKMVRNGKARDVSEDKKVPWIEFAEDNVLWTGKGEKSKQRGEWWLDDDDKTLYLIIDNREEKMTVKRLSKTKLVLIFEDGRRSTKAFWNKVS